MSDDPIRRRDEILQVMFWLRGEGLGEAVTAASLLPFIGAADAAAVLLDLQALRAAGLVADAGAGGFRLTDAGVREGGRRFADEFADITRQAHGACSDPDCDCHELGPEACAHAGGH